MARGGPNPTRCARERELRRANAFLEAIAEKAEPGSMIDVTPAELGKQVGVVEPLAAAQAVQALLARRRLEAVDGRYRLLDTRPIEPGREQVPRPPRSPKGPSSGRAPSGTAMPPTPRSAARWSNGRSSSAGKSGRCGARCGPGRSASRARRATRRSSGRSSSPPGSRRLEGRAEMAEANLRTLLAAAKGTGHATPRGRHRDGSDPRSAEARPRRGAS